MNIPKQECTAEFGELAVQRGKEKPRTGAVAPYLGWVEQSLRHWVKAFDTSKLNNPGAKKGTVERGNFRSDGPRASGSRRNQPSLNPTEQLGSAR